MAEGRPSASWWENSASETWVGPTSDPDRYRVHSSNSSGSEGTLFRGSFDLDGHTIPVAIKRLHEAREQDVDAWQTRWERQTEILRTLSHPGLVGVRESFLGSPPHPRNSPGMDDKALYLVMNWARGEPLDTWSEGRAPAELILVLSRLAASVDYLHSGEATGGVGVIHRDIKPANVIVDTGQPKLVDFGFARLDRASDSTIIVYSEGFAPPEVLGGAPGGAASDRYSFAATALWVLSGFRSDATNPLDATSALMDAGVPSPVARSMQRLLDPDPAKRPTTLAEFRAAAAQHGGSSRPVPISGVAADRPAPIGPAANPHSLSGAGASFSSGTVARPAQPSRSAELVGGSSSPSGLRSASVRPWIGTVLAALAVVASVILGLWAWSNKDGQTFTVPEVEGLTQDEAVGELRNLGASVATEIVESSAESGTVVTSDPDAGSVLPAGYEVRLEVSSSSFEMPDLVGNPARAAAQDLVDKGLELDQIKWTADDSGTDSTAECTITNQRPSAGTSVNKTGQGELVELWSTRAASTDGDCFA